MIYDNINVGKIKGVSVAEFNGIEIVAAKGEKYVSLLMREEGDGEDIDSITMEHIHTDRWNPKMILLFYDKESIDQLITTLNEVKSLL